MSDIPPSSLSQRPVVIIGAGLAGLACALRLQRADVPAILLEASDGVGGRVRTDVLDGFLLDRGFQVLSTAYPELRAHLDPRVLRPGRFMPGAMVRAGGSFHSILDPWRAPLAALRGLFAPVAGLADKWRLARLRRQLRRGTVDDLFARPETSTLKALQELGFSSRMIDRFWRPFLGGIFLESELRTSSRMFAFVFRMFAEGSAVLPASGMQALPDHLARGLATDSLRLHARVAHVGQGGVTLDSGERVAARAVVLATDGPAAAALAGDTLLTPPASRSVTCLYFDASRPPVSERILVLNGEGSGPVQTLCVPSQVSSGYAPDGRSLVSVSVPGDPDVDDEALAASVLEQLTGWFGADVAGWRLLRIYRVLHAQPEQGPNGLAEPHRPVRLRRGLYVCGDHRDNASIDGALVSGRRAAEALLDDLRG